MKSRWFSCFTILLSLCTNAALANNSVSQLHSFGISSLSSANPYTPVIMGSDGALYGTTSSRGQANQGTVFRLNPDGSGFLLLKSFGVDTNDGARPFAGLREASDGALYGTTEEGGLFGFGTVFQINKDGSHYTVLKNFSSGVDGAYPEAELLEASDGLLYGTASGGGTNDSGVVFRLAKDGSSFTSLFQFSGTNGTNPEAGLLEASDGMLYGTTCSKDATNRGTIFRLQKDGSAFSVLQNFLTTGTIQTNGAAPQARLVEGTNGVLYGTTSGGGTNRTGTVFEINKDGSGFSTVYHFGTNTTTDGRIPLGNLLLASDGMLYGTTYDGGTNGNGVVFRLAQNGTGYSVIASLRSPQGAAASLIEGTNGLLYGTTQSGGDAGDGTVFVLQKDGAALIVLKSFSRSGGDGQSPYSGPIAGSDNSLYGTTRIGGDAGAGALYAVSFDGFGYNLLCTNQGTNGPINPLGPLLEATNGTLYGITQFGGQSNNGTLFTADKTGANLAVVYDWTNNTDGRELRAGLLQGSDGALYGATVYGGTGGDGTVFRVNPDGSGYTVLKNFSFGSTGPGANPLQRLLEGSDHNLYGVTYNGGITNRGVIFTLSKDGSSFNILKAFGSPAKEGENPMSPLIEASDGMLYGSAYGGGSTNNAGTVFRLNKDGTSFSVVVSFLGPGPDGRHPCGGLVEWNNGALYGTTERGGINDQGTLFRVNKDGSGYAILVSFGGSLGVYPRGGLVRGPDGALYGTTDQGGDMGFGTVFRFGPGFGEIVSLQLANQLPMLIGVGLPGTNYVLERSLDLGSPLSWSPVLSTNTPPNGQFSIVDQTAAGSGTPSAFYRLKR